MTEEILEAEESVSTYAAFIDFLQKNQKLRDSDLSRAKKIQEQAAEEGLPSLLIKLGLCSENDVAVAMASSENIELVKKDEYPEVSPIPSSISLRFLRENRIIGLEEKPEELIVATIDPIQKSVIEALILACQKEVSVKVGVASEIERALELQYGDGKTNMGLFSDGMDGEEIGEDEIEHLKDLASEAPVIRMVNIIMQRALETEASDIHFEPFEQSLKVRLRIDGVLQEVEAPPVSSTAAVISRIKIMAKLNIAERRLPQDGRIKIQMSGKELDLRVSTIPTMYGESVVIRLLNKENVKFDFSALGFDGTHSKRFVKILSKPHGILLITGPTGSGKSTTLYTALNQLNTPDRKIITVEDPVEYQLEGVNQIQAKPQIGLNFASALRSIVRQDPDVIMIGEMRDLETAKIAVQSAMTGHLVLSTLHTNDAAGGVTRLLDMGLEDYLLTSTVNGILGQRLVKKLCTHCKVIYPVMPEMVSEMGLRRLVPEGEIKLFHPVGCDHCGGIGYRGRIAIMEFLVMTDGIRKLIMSHMEAGKIQEAAVKEGMVTMYDDGLMKAMEGITTIEEILRVTTET
ncbi:MAG: type II secretion system ATPase GspE [Methylococcaceae bacterium]